MLETKSCFHENLDQTNDLECFHCSFNCRLFFNSNPITMITPQPQPPIQLPPTFLCEGGCTLSGETAMSRWWVGFQQHNNTWLLKLNLGMWDTCQAGIVFFYIHKNTFEDLKGENRVRRSMTVDKKTITKELLNRNNFQALMTELDLDKKGFLCWLNYYFLMFIFLWKWFIYLLWGPV